jgi:hypothetical protein
VDRSLEAYKPAPVGILFVPQILSEVLLIHELENESKRMFGGRVHSDKRDNVLVPETATRQCFFVEPLTIDFQSMGHAEGRYHSLCRSASNLMMNSICRT